MFEVDQIHVGAHGHGLRRPVVKPPREKSSSRGGEATRYRDQFARVLQPVQLGLPHRARGAFRLADGQHDVGLAGTLLADHHVEFVAGAMPGAGENRRPHGARPAAHGPRRGMPPAPLPGGLVGVTR